MSVHLARLKPAPLPAVHPVPEYATDERLAAVYADTKSVLQVPWMGVVTMAFAHYPTFYDTLWGGLRDLAGSRAFVAACGDLRDFAETRADSLAPAPMGATLDTLGYGAREIDDIKAMIEIFSHGNMPYLMIATAARLLLEGHDLSGDTDVTPETARHGPSLEKSLTLIEPHHADAPTVNVYDDIKARLGLPFVNTDYRALARWPSYFAPAWGDLAPKVETSGYEDVVASVHDFAVARMCTLPNPGALTPGALREAAAKDADVDEVLAVVRLFQWLLPGLITNVAYFRAQL
ncbi:MAG: hypothetical protein JJ900_15845 [Rhodospirillales bacterium]|nr:hypothetical protein [Rhodospirillales bacterium]MBO6788320.1 hypothetical protein [Rhodospirillales bacterium]